MVDIGGLWGSANVGLITHAWIYFSYRYEYAGGPRLDTRNVAGTVRVVVVVIVRSFVVIVAVSLSLLSTELAGQAVGAAFYGLGVGDKLGIRVGAFRVYRHVRHGRHRASCDDICG